jgi:hypothetical protein
VNELVNESLQKTAIGKTKGDFLLRIHLTVKQPQQLQKTA